MALDPVAAVDAEAHLARLDDAVPGLVTAVHVTGSAVLDDYRPGISDLDLVAETSHAVGPAELAALAEAHAGVAVETVFVSGGLGSGGPAPWVRDGVAHPEDSDQLHAITWLQLARYAATLRGPRPTVPADIPAAQAFCRANLRSYWAPVLADTGAALRGRGADDPCRAEGAMWIALGPARLWHTIRTGEVISKTRAGEVAVERWPDLAGPIGEIRAVRAGARITLTTRHALAAVDLGNRIVSDTAQAAP